MAAEPRIQAIAGRRRKLPFVKMHGLGNDFVVVEASRLDGPLDADTAHRLADRRLGIGCDQLLVLETAAAPLRYRIFNADGGEVEQCGNGARCLARYAVERGLAAASDVRLESPAGAVEARVEGPTVSINLGAPRLAPAEIPFVAATQAVEYTVDVDGEAVTLGALSLGNPHAVIAVDSVEHAPVARLGARLERHPRFPRRANVGFVEFLAADRCRLRVFERGVGETPACGTGAAAAVVWGRLAGRLGARATVVLRGGELGVEWAGRGAPVWLSGPATRVFEGEIEL